MERSERAHTKISVQANNALARLHTQGKEPAHVVHLFVLFSGHLVSLVYVEVPQVISCLAKSKVLRNKLL